MNGMEFLRKLRAHAKERGLPFKVVSNRGKGGHQMVHLGNHKTTIPSPHKELKPGTLHEICKSLGVAKF